jgi:hypothetical protein
MTQEMDDRIKELCEMVAKEQDKHVFIDLMMELDQRLEAREKQNQPGSIQLPSARRGESRGADSPPFRPAE